MQNELEEYRSTLELIDKIDKGLKMLKQQKAALYSVGQKELSALRKKYPNLRIKIVKERKNLPDLLCEHYEDPSCIYCDCGIKLPGEVLAGFSVFSKDGGLICGECGSDDCNRVKLVINIMEKSKQINKNVF